MSVRKMQEYIATQQDNTKILLDFIEEYQQLQHRIKLADAKLENMHDCFEQHPITIEQIKRVRHVLEHGDD